MSITTAPAIALIATSFTLAACSSAFYGGATGAYLATGGYGHCIDYGGAADPPRQCGGGADAAFVVGAIVIGAAIGAVVEIVKWLTHPGDSW